MAVTPELEAPTRVDAVEERPVPIAPDRVRTRASIWPWARLALLLVTAVASELVYVVFWPLSFQLTLFTMPGLFTTDLFSYATYGQIAGVYGVSPYTHLPSAFPEFRILSWIHPLWHDAPSIYGPAWVDLTRPLARSIVGWSDVD